MVVIKDLSGGSESDEEEEDHRAKKKMKLEEIKSEGEDDGERNAKLNSEIGSSSSSSGGILIQSQSQNEEEDRLKAVFMEIFHSLASTIHQITDLPDDVMKHILSFLPNTKYALRTSLVCQQWIDHWQHIDVLIFDAYSAPFNPDFSADVHRVIQSHRHRRMKKFTIRYDVRLPLDPRLGEKLWHAIEQGNVEEVDLFAYNQERVLYVLPPFFMISQSLVRLVLFNCALRPGVNWSNLKFLTLGCRGLPFASIANTVSRIFSLESLGLCFFNAYVDGIIESNSLQTLKFLDAHGHGVDNIEIRCPNLHTLSVRQNTIEANGLSIDTIDTIFNGCPMLSNMILRDFRYEELFISSNFLRKLVLGFNHEAAGFEISCPNLKELVLFDLRFDHLKIQRANCHIVAFKKPLPEDEHLTLLLIKELQDKHQVEIFQFEDGFIRNFQVIFS